MESLIEVYKQSDKKDFWKKFNADKEDKEWFEQEVLSMFKESGWNHPLVGIYEKLIVQFKELAG